MDAGTDHPLPGKGGRNIKHENTKQGNIMGKGIVSIIKLVGKLIL